MAFFFNSTDSSNDIVDVDTHINNDGHVIIQFGVGRDGRSHLCLGAIEAKLLAQNILMVVKELADSLGD